MEEKRHRRTKEKTNRATFRGKLTSSGRVTVPKPVRESLSLEKGKSIIDITVEVVKRGE